MPTWSDPTPAFDVSDGHPSTPAPRPLERIGSPATVAALAILVVVGLGIALVALVQDALEASRASRRSSEIARISDASIAALTALQWERGLGELFLASGDPDDRARYEASFPDTDQAAEEYAATWSANGSEMRVEQAGALNGVVTALTPLDDLRDAVTSASAEAGVDVYAGLVDPIRQTLSDMAVLTTDAEDVRLRRAVLSLMDASAALATRRAMVAAMLADPGPVTPQEEIQISLLGREYEVDMRSAQALLSDEERDLVADLARSAEKEAADGTLDRIIVGGDPEPTPQSWFAIASAEIDRVTSMAMDLNDDLRDRASAGIAQARRNAAFTTVFLGALFLLSILAAWSAITASRQRAKALDEHRELVDGLLRWFGSDAMPVVDGLDIEVRYLAAAEHAGAGGDWYDVFFDGEGNLALVVGDVSGHGSRTVAHMAEMRNMIRAMAHAGIGGPARQLEVIDRTVESGELTTVFYAAIPAGGGDLSYSRAGHVPGLLRRASGEIVLLDGGSDTPVGMAPSEVRSEETIELAEDDILLLFTDGLIEEPGKDLYESIAGLSAEVAAHRGSLDILADALLANRPVHNAGDDASVLLVRVNSREALTLGQEGLAQAGYLQDSGHRH